MPQVFTQRKAPLEVCTTPANQGLRLRAFPSRTSERGKHSTEDTNSGSIDSDNCSRNHHYRRGVVAVDHRSPGIPAHSAPPINIAARIVCLDALILLAQPFIDESAHSGVYPWFIWHGFLLPQQISMSLPKNVLLNSKPRIEPMLVFGEIVNTSIDCHTAN